ncbi:MAG: serine/threonine-protein kinase [Fibrobacterota bacterium]
MKSIFDYINIDYNSYIGTDLGDVTLLSVIGSGGKGVVFSGFQRDLKRRVAVKLLPKLKASAAEIEDFHREAEIVAGLMHPNIIPIYRMGESEEFYYQVMQMVDGKNLFTVTAERRRHPVPAKRHLPVGDVLNYMDNILDALDYSHEEDVLHRDIKPANILIADRRQHLFVADFGIATAPGMAAAVKDGSVVGSPYYLSPEQARGDTPDPRTDVYSAGITLLFMLCGRVPVRTDEGPEEILRRKILYPETFLNWNAAELHGQHISAQLREVIAHSVAPDRAQRYSSVDTFRSELQNIQI